MLGRSLGANTLSPSSVWGRQDALHCPAWQLGVPQVSGCGTSGLCGELNREVGPVRPQSSCGSLCGCFPEAPWPRPLPIVREDVFLFVLEGEAGRLKEHVALVSCPCCSLRAALASCK